MDSGGGYHRFTPLIDMTLSSDDDDDDDSSYNNTNIRSNNHDIEVINLLSDDEEEVVDIHPTLPPTSRIIQPLELLSNVSHDLQQITRNNIFPALFQTPNKRSRDDIDHSTDKKSNKKLKSDIELKSNLRIRVKKEFQTQPLSFGEADIPDELEEVMLPSSSEIDTIASGITSNGDEIEVVSSNMQSLSDMPHPRETCTICPFKFNDTISNIKFCPQCHCFVCEIKSSLCSDWNRHCNATWKITSWKEERASLKTSKLLLFLPPNDRVRINSIINNFGMSKLKQRDYYSDDDNDSYDSYNYYEGNRWDHSSNTNKEFCNDRIKVYVDKVYDTIQNYNSSNIEFTNPQIVEYIHVFINIVFEFSKYLHSTTTTTMVTCMYSLLFHDYISLDISVCRNIIDLIKSRQDVQIQSNRLIRFLLVYINLIINNNSPTSNLSTYLTKYLSKSDRTVSLAIITVLFEMKNIDLAVECVNTFKITENLNDIPNDLACKMLNYYYDNKDFKEFMKYFDSFSSSKSSYFGNLHPQITILIMLNEISSYNPYLLINEDELAVKILHYLSLIVNSMKIFEYKPLVVSDDSLDFNLDIVNNQLNEIYPNISLKLEFINSFSTTSELDLFDYTDLDWKTLLISLLSLLFKFNEFKTWTALMKIMSYTNSYYHGLETLSLYQQMLLIEFFNRCDDFKLLSLYILDFKFLQTIKSHPRINRLDFYKILPYSILKRCGELETNSLFMQSLEINRYTDFFLSVNGCKELLKLVSNQTIVNTLNANENMLLISIVYKSCHYNILCNESSNYKCFFVDFFQFVNTFLKFFVVESTDNVRLECSNMINFADKYMELAVCSLYIFSTNKVASQSTSISAANSIRFLKKYIINFFNTENCENGIYSCDSVISFWLQMLEMSKNVNADTFQRISVRDNKYLFDVLLEKDITEFYAYESAHALVVINNDDFRSETYKDKFIEKIFSSSIVHSYFDNFNIYYDDSSLVNDNCFVNFMGFEKRHIDRDMNIAKKTLIPKIISNLLTQDLGEMKKIEFISTISGNILDRLPLIKSENILSYLLVAIVIDNYELLKSLLDHCFDVYKNQILCLERCIKSEDVDNFMSIIADTLLSKTKDLVERKLEVRVVSKTINKKSSKIQPIVNTVNIQSNDKVVHNPANEQSDELDELYIENEDNNVDTTTGKKYKSLSTNLKSSITSLIFKSIHEYSKSFSSYTLCNLYEHLLPYISDVFLANDFDTILVFRKITEDLMNKEMNNPIMNSTCLLNFLNEILFYITLDIKHIQTIINNMTMINNTSISNSTANSNQRSILQRISNWIITSLLSGRIDRLKLLDIICNVYDPEMLSHYLNYLLFCDIDKTVLLGNLYDCIIKYNRHMEILYIYYIKYSLINYDVVKFNYKTIPSTFFSIIKDVVNYSCTTDIRLPYDNIFDINNSPNVAITNEIKRTFNDNSKKLSGLIKSFMPNDKLISVDTDLSIDSFYSMISANLNLKETELLDKFINEPTYINVTNLQAIEDYNSIKFYIFDIYLNCHDNTNFIENITILLNNHEYKYLINILLESISFNNFNVSNEDKTIKNCINIIETLTACLTIEHLTTCSDDSSNSNYYVTLESKLDSQLASKFSFIRQFQRLVYKIYDISNKYHVSAELLNKLKLFNKKIQTLTNSHTGISLVLTSLNQFNAANIEKFIEYYYQQNNQIIPEQIIVSLIYSLHTLYISNESLVTIVITLNEMKKNKKISESYSFLFNNEIFKHLIDYILKCSCYIFNTNLQIKFLSFGIFNEVVTTATLAATLIVNIINHNVKSKYPREYNSSVINKMLYRSDIFLLNVFELNIFNMLYYDCICYYKYQLEVKQKKLLNTIYYYAISSELLSIINELVIKSSANYKYFAMLLIFENYERVRSQFEPEKFSQSLDICNHKNIFVKYVAIITTLSYNRQLFSTEILINIVITIIDKCTNNNIDKVNVLISKLLKTHLSEEHQIFAFITSFNKTYYNNDALLLKALSNDLLCKYLLFNKFKAISIYNILHCLSTNILLYNKLIHCENLHPYFESFFNELVNYLNSTRVTKQIRDNFEELSIILRDVIHTNKVFSTKWNYALKPKLLKLLSKKKPLQNALNNI